jgi:neurocan core protein
MAALMMILLMLYAIADVTRAAELEIKPKGDVQRKALGLSIVFTCEVMGESAGGGASNRIPNYDIQWLDQKDRPITDKAGNEMSRIYIEDDSDTARKLYITSIAESDAGRYACTANVDGEKRRKTVNLAQFQEISFDHAPRVQHPRIHTRALIECRVSGAPSISWRYGSERIPSGAEGKYEVDPKLGLWIKNITQADDGDYTCRAEVEAEGRYDQRKITVTVHIPPTFTKLLPPSQTAVEGDKLEMECRATGLPMPKYEFLRNGSLPLVSSDRVSVDTDAGNLVFSPVRHEDTGRYTCRVHNDVGTNTSVGSLEILGQPFALRYSHIKEDKR